MPDARYIATKLVWERDFHRTIRPGEKGVDFLIFLSRHAVQKAKQERNDKPIHSSSTFIPTVVYDVSQTEGSPFPSLATNLIPYTVENYENLAKAIQNAFPYPIVFEANLFKAKDKYSNTILLRAGMPDRLNIYYMIRWEIFSQLQASSTSLPRMEKYNGYQDYLHAKNVLASAAAHLVCEHLKIEMYDYSMAEIVSWSRGQTSALELTHFADTLEARTVDAIDAIDAQLAEIEKASRPQILPEKAAAPAQEKKTSIKERIVIAQEESAKHNSLHAADKPQQNKGQER